MLGLLQRILKRTFATADKVKTRVIDPWNGSGGRYVDTFKRELNEIAAELSQEGRLVRTRFNSDLGCAELYVPGGDVIAKVEVWGEAGAPYKVMITPLSLQETERTLFAKFLQGIRVEFRAAA